ncbi:MAG: hypothetical protein NTY16_11120, partial [Deltaproteobacteria bacterium]|nr:hypothetical protein [Deltaproteobacteria bacterium]
MEKDKDTTEISPQKVLINLPDGTEWGPDDGGDFQEFFEKIAEFVKSPEFVGKILPVLSEQFLRKHKETMEHLAIEKQKLMLRGKYEVQFLLARLGIGVALIGSVTWLTINGHLATETT